MGKIIKTMQSKHKETLSPWLKNYVETASTIDLPSLPNHLSTFPSRWPFGRGDLYHWIPLLNRFDSILEHFNKTYALNEGPQSRDFAADVLLNRAKDSAFSSEKQWTYEELQELGFSADGDRVLIEAVLLFTRMLLEHCGNRSIYASSPHLNDLLNTTALSVLISTLEVGSELAQRYQASVKRIGNASRQISAALLANHYNIDIERVQQIALPFVKTPIVSLADPASSITPVSTKGKEKAHGSSSRNSTPTHANDLVAIATCDDAMWQGWGDVKVLYYPQDSHVGVDVSNDTGRTSLPSTPTPLRRSHTVGSQQNTPRARNIGTDDSSPIIPRTPAVSEEHAIPGQKSFDLPKSVVSTTSIYDLVKRCPDDMPSSAKYELFHRVRVAKALTESLESRQKILAIRLLAITNLAYIHTESNFVDKVLRHDIDETRRYQLVYQLAELIHPSADGHSKIPLWLQTFALALLEAVSGFHARCQDVLSALNANVNHGILLYVIRKAVAGMQVDEATDIGDQASEADDWRNNLFSLTLHLSMATRVGSEMVSAGLMDILVEILHIRSQVAQRHHSMVLAFLDGLIWTYQNAFTAFFNASGLGAVAQLLVDAVTEAQNSLKSSKGVKPDQQSVVVDYEIPYYQQQTLKWLLKFVHHIMSNSYSYGGNTERLLRNLAENSDLLHSLREIMANKQSFGSVVWTNSVTILSDFINNDPTSFAAISESGMIKTYLEAITGQPVPEQQQGGESKQAEQHQEDQGDAESPDSSAAAASIADEDDRPHPPSDDDIRRTRRNKPAEGILASSEAINIVPQVLNSICLNNMGMKLVVASRAFDSYLEIFESSQHVSCMEADSDLAGNVGANFDELARHHPPLRTSISNAVIDMVARVRWLGIERGMESDWGARLYVTTAEGTVVTVHPNEHFMKAPTVESAPERQGATTEGADVDMSDAASTNETITEKNKKPQKLAPAQSLTPYIHGLANFLTGYLSNTLLKVNFVRKGGIELLLDLCESPSLDASFGDSSASRVLNQVIAQLVEHSPVRGLPSLLRRAQSNIDVLKPLAAKTEALPPYFGAFLATDLHVWSDDPEQSKVVLQATQKIKALLNAQNLIKIISDCFTTSRSNALQFYPVNIYDYYLKLVKSIGPLLRGILAEEAGELSVVPQHWSLRRQGFLGVTNTSEGRDAAGSDETSIPDVLNDAARSWPSADGTDTSAPVEPTEQERSSARFMNYEILHTLLHPMIPTSFPLFQSLGKALLPRREPNHLDPFPRPRQLEIAMALADTVLSHLGPSVAQAEPTSKDFHYWIIMLHTIHEMLIDHPSPRQSDRSNVQIIMPVLLAFKEQGGLDVLNSILRILASSVKAGPDSNIDETSKVKVAAFGLKKVLDLYYILVNGKYLSESSNHFNLHRQADRSQNIPNVAQQIVVEFRAAILPAIMELWTSNFVEKVPDATVKRLLDILKIVCAAEHEPQAIPKDAKAPLMLFKYTDARFNWASVQSVVKEVIDTGFEEDLVHEAVYRANGNTAPVIEYCRAHTDGLAGPRNPIPPEDADISALQQESSAVQEDQSNTVTAPDSDQMILDALPDISADDMVEYVDRHIGNIQADNDNSSEATGVTSSNHRDDTTDKIPTMNFVVNFNVVKDELDNMRSKIRAQLIDQCLDVIRTHPETAIEVSDLVSTTILRRQNQEAQEEVASTLTFALSSLSLDEDEKRRNGKCIAAYAHLLALLLQDENFFEHNKENLADKVDEYVGFLKVPLSSSTDELPPWIPYILLVLEALLCHDERPVPVQWKPPKSLEDPVSEPVIRLGLPLVGDENCNKILESLLNLLPRIGKEEILATAVLRVLLILTRKRRLAKVVGEKKNLQRLFLMAKQLSGSGSERLKQTRLTAHIITILRHIIEDEDIIKQIMRAEIQADFPNLIRNQRGHPDVSSFLRAMAPVALRAPDLFVEVTNEVLRFQRWMAPSGDSNRSQALVWKDQQSDSKTEEEKPTADGSSSDTVKPSTELADKEMADVPKAHHDIKRPVVENPDGVIHFLLCELVNYREVDDKEPSAPSDLNTEVTGTANLRDPSSKDISAADGKDKKQSKPLFKAEEHPIFVYRCFLLNCLAELLQSYTRTKVEFINFKRSAPPLSTTTPIKPRTSILNYLIYDLLCQGNLNGTTDTIVSKKKAATSSLTQKVLVALVSKTSEKAADRRADKFVYDDEPDLLFVRKFVLDTILKAYEKAPLTDEPLETRYSRMQCLAELMNHMIGERDRDQNPNSRGSDSLQSRSQAQLRRLMYEKGYVDKLTSSIAEISLSYPGVKRAIKYILRVLRVLTSTAKELSQSSILPADPAGDHSDEEFASSSSLSDDGDSGWESESDVEEDDDPDQDALDYDAEVQEEGEAHMHGMAPGDLLDNMARAIMGDDGGYDPDLGLDDHYLDDEHEDGEDEDEDEDIDDEEYIYDEDYPDDQLPPMPSLGWDAVNPDMDDRHRNMLLVDGHRRPVLARMDNRSSFPGRFLGGSHRDQLGEFRSYFTSRNHRSTGAQSNAEDGLNPLLRRSDQANEGLPRPGQTHALDLRIPPGLLGAGRHSMDGPMGLLGELMEFLPMMSQSGNGQQAFHFHITGPGAPREFRDLGPARWVRTDNRRDATAQEPHQAVSFTAESTLDRYQEEARMIFGVNHTTEAFKLINIITAQLTPAAMELEKKIKAEEAEHQRRADEERKKREEEERLTQEAKAAEEKAAREKEAKEREEQERLARERLATAETTENEQPDRSSEEAMEGIETSGPSSEPQSAVEPGSTSAAAEQPRVMTTIRGEEVDVTELGIDPEYLAALPEEFREEVIAQTVSERRSQAREEAAAGESTDVFQEFLDALPDELRQEIAQQERQEERRRNREEARRQATVPSGQPPPAEMDAASILLTFPPALRQQVLMDQGEDIMDQLTPEMAAQARALSQHHPPMPQHQGVRSIVTPGQGPPQAAARDNSEGKAQRRAVVQILDKSGVATLLRLMFIAQQGSIRNYLFSVFADVCENRQNRLEVVSTILQILQEGSTDMNAVERSFGQLSIKARKHKERETDQKTPQSLKKTLTNLGTTATQVQQTNSETSPLLIVQQCLDLLVDLCTRSQHIPWLFLTEHEVVGSTLKRALSRKGKIKDSKAHKYAINSLLTLLDREIVIESSVVMTHLADLLNRVTLPLLSLDRKRKDTTEEVRKEAPVATEGEQRSASAEQQPPETGTSTEPPAGQIPTSEQNADAAEGEPHQQKKEPGSKKPRQLQPPVIPPQNLTLVVKIFVARECSSKTFQNTISTIKNLSAIPGAKAVFGQELVKQARLLSENIVSDLDDLLPHIEQATSGTEIQGVALAKFSPGASEQNKLLRVLTALDHLFDGRKKGGDGETEESKEHDKQHLVTSLYHNSTFSAMWEKLSACLKAIRERENMLNVATILLPLIESLMVVCKNTTASDDLSQSQASKGMVLSSPPPEARTASLFFAFTEDHRRILNELVRNNPKLMSGTFALLVKNPKVLEFDNKRNYFNRSVHSRSNQNSRPSYPPLQLSVRRDHVFHDSFRSLYFKSGDEMKFGKLNIRFHGEEGVDAGGVTREWFQVLARQMFDPNYALFTPVSSDRTTFHPNKLSGINPEHLMFFKFIGRIIGKALYEGRLLDCFFSRAVYKRILGKSVSVKDMESFDPDYYKSLCWMLDNDITDIITETFSVEDDEFGVTNVFDLVPNGRDVAVTEDNKHEYVRLVVEHKLLSSVKEQMEKFLQEYESYDMLRAQLHKAITQGSEYFGFA
ncbi:E3 ubiquitin-protein ligase TOM1-like [Metarhizium anisopliae]|nr:E3 ubiquitin-protein ligase TOM1-like [Metarhizium anisopliae]